LKLKKHAATLVKNKKKNDLMDLLGVFSAVRLPKKLRNAQN
jgi:hypothetical protein